MCSVFIKHSSTFHIQLCNVASLVVQEEYGSLAWTLSYFSRKKNKRKGSLLCLLDGFTQTILNNNNNIAIGLLLCTQGIACKIAKTKHCHRHFIISTKGIECKIRNIFQVASMSSVAKKKLFPTSQPYPPPPNPMQGYSLPSRCGRLESETCWRAKGRRSPPE